LLASGIGVASFVNARLRHALSDAAA